MESERESLHRGASARPQPGVTSTCSREAGGEPPPRSAPTPSDLVETKARPPADVESGGVGNLGSRKEEKAWRLPELGEGSG